MVKPDEYDNEVWTVTVNRWSERDARYRFTTNETRSPIVICADADGHRACRSQHKKDEAAGYMVLELRNHELQSLECDPYQHTLEVWTGQRSIRAWRRTSKTRLPRPHGPRCLCQHAPEQHQDAGKGPCRIDGCGCEVFYLKQRGESLAACTARFLQEYGASDVRKPRMPVSKSHADFTGT